VLKIRDFIGERNILLFISAILVISGIIFTMAFLIPYVNLMSEMIRAETGITMSELTDEMNKLDEGIMFVQFFKKFIGVIVIFCLLFIIGFILNIIAWLKNSEGLALGAGILYSFSNWVNAVLCFIAYSQLRKK
jgi:hypothetical protein